MTTNSSEPEASGLAKLRQMIEDKLAHRRRLNEGLSSYRAQRVISLTFAEADAVLKALDAERAAPSVVPPEPWFQRILDNYREDLSKEACDACEDCSQFVMCRFHSLLSLLMHGTYLDEAHFKAAGRVEPSISPSTAEEQAK